MPIQAFNWPPTDDDLAELETIEVEVVTAFVPPLELTASVVDAAWPVDPLAAVDLPPPVDPLVAPVQGGEAWTSRRANLLGLAILLGLGTAVGAGTALLLSPRTSSPSAADTAAWRSLSGSSTASPSARARSARPPDLTVIAEYPSVDVRAPRGTGASTVPPPGPPALNATPPSVDRTALAPAPVPESLPSLAMPSPPPTATATPPSVAATPVPVAAAPVPAVVTERTAIERLLTRYRTAYEQLDIRAAAGVWPTVDTTELARAFSTLSQQQISFERCDIKIADRTATAACDGELRYVRRVGRASWQRRAAAWTFDLSRVGDSWTIQGVRAR